MTSGKVNHQPAYVLHTQPYRESSLLLEVLTCDYGRLPLVARGARRPRAELRGLVLPFQPLVVAWFGNNAIKTLHAATWVGGVRQLSGLALVSGFYLNELVLRLTARDDPHVALWSLYDKAVRALARRDPIAEVLRRFELGLISSLGYAPQLTTDNYGMIVEPERYYECRPGRAPDSESRTDAADVAQLKGASLLAMAANDFSDPFTRQEARGLLRLILAELLGPKALFSKELLQSLHAVTRWGLQRDETWE